MSDRESSETLFTVRTNGTAHLKFPVPPELEQYTQSCELTDQAIEYYLLARYAFLHRMHSSFMVNSFWSVEYLVLSILVFKYPTKEDLLRDHSSHDVHTYWNDAKKLVSVVSADAADLMKKFDPYIGKVKGFFDERYPKKQRRIKVIHTEKNPAIQQGSGDAARRLKTGKIYPLNLNELDNFVNFMLHDITTYQNNCSENLMQYLDLTKNGALYETDNNYSITYPNKKYNGERQESGRP